jgi:hypothetical protein
MKKIENFLFLPVLILLFYTRSAAAENTTFFHWQHNSVEFNNGSAAGWALAWLTLVFLLFKIVRLRHRTINLKFAISYNVLSLLFFLVLCLPTSPETGVNGISDAQLYRWNLYNQTRAMSWTIFILTQVIFLIYFIFQLIKKPIIRRP